MKTWLADFSARFEEALHRLLWCQWTLLGVAGVTSPVEARAPIDPEALLLLTLESARTEPRLFDEVLDWLRSHGTWIDVQRLKNLLRDDPETPPRLVAAVAAFTGHQVASAKWKRLAAPPRKPPAKAEQLFLLSGFKWSGSTYLPDGLFRRFGYQRPPIELRDLTGPIPVRLAAALRFRLRAMFGIGIRAEALCYLISGGEGNAKEISRFAGYSSLGTLQAVRELALSESVNYRMKGREKIYWADTYRWLEFLAVEDRLSPGRLFSTPQGLDYEEAGLRGPRDAKGRLTRYSKAPVVTWVNWRSYFEGMATILRFLRRPDLSRLTPYVAASELHSVFTMAVGKHLSAVEEPFRLPLPSGKSQEYGEIILKSLAMAAGEPLHKEKG